MTVEKLVALAAAVACTGAFANPPANQTITTATDTTISSTTTTTVAEFRSLDTNKDGMVSREEAAVNTDLAAQFDALDADNDGSLSTAEYAKGTGKDHSNKNKHKDESGTPGNH